MFGLSTGNLKRNDTFCKSHIISLILGFNLTSTWNSFCWRVEIVDCRLKIVGLKC